MKIAFIIEHYPPFAPGGSEWSTYYLAKNLIQKGIKVIIITPNLGADRMEIKNGLTVKRYPFYQKSKSPKQIPGHFSYTNPLWIIWSSIFMYLCLRKENIDIIHVHGKYSLPPAFFANLFLKRPLVATLRDYSMICNYGICLMSKDKACNLFDYFTNDFRKYFQIYVWPKNLQTLFLNILYAFWGRLSKNLLKFFASSVDLIIAVSKKEKEILQRNGIKPPITVVYNSFIFRDTKNYKREDFILYVGRLTYGKGINLLLKAIPSVTKKYPNIKFLFAGQGFLFKRIKSQAKNYKNIVLLGHLRHQELFLYYQKAKAVVVPSIWPEPLPRVAIESLSFLTPVVGTRCGGIPEIVKDGKYGYLTNRSPKDLAQALIKTILNNRVLRENINQNFAEIKKKYTTDVVQAHLKIYENLFAKN